MFIHIGTGPKAIIIGGGIGGLTTAIALQRIGWQVTVLERTEVLREVGSGLPLWTNAQRALQKLGLAEELAAIGIDVTAGRVSTWQGTTLADMSTEDLLQKLGTISTVVHRAELHTLLLKACGSENVHLGTSCIGVRQDTNGVTVLLANGDEVHGDIVIGADGIHSVIRSQLFSAKPPKYVGYTCWRGVAEIDGTGLETWAWGKGYQFGITPMTNHRAYWFAQYDAPEGTSAKPCGKKQELLARFQDWHDPIPRVIEATSEAHILHNDVYEHEHLHHWCQGRVALLGDAAHAMTPNLGQGGCQAIEDAVVLAHCLQDEQDVVAALKLYEAQRVKRANSIGQLAGRIGRVVQWQNPLASGLRNAILQRIPTSVLIQQLLWILAYEA